MICHCIHLTRTLVCCLALFTGAVALATEYRLGPGDRIKLTVFGHEDLSGEFEVDAAGNLSLPLIQLVPASGSTLPELERAITEKLKPDYLKNPRISAEILNYRPFFILGEVEQPGSYPYVAGTTLIRAVAMAGGYTYRAKKSKVVIRRGEENGTQQITASPDTVILPGDVIEVPERFF